MDWRRLKNNPDLWDIFKRRAVILDKIREFFRKEGFLEVQTPNLSPYLIPESYLEIFETKIFDRLGKSERAYLTPSPELWHKKLLAAGSGNIFEITKSFRNTDLGGYFHNPEFTILEWYRVEADYHKTMNDCEELIRFLNNGRSSLVYQGKDLSITQPFLRISVKEAFERYAKIKEDVLFDSKKLVNEAKRRGYSLEEKDDWGVAFNLVYLKEIEPNLGWDRPTIIYGFPTQFAPLAKTDLQDCRVKRRFELYLFGIELADGYDELIDPEKQKEEFIEEQRRRQALGRIRIKPDWEFIEALESGIPPCSGVALGVDRLVMIFTNRTDISEVVLFSGKDIFSGMLK